MKRKSLWLYISLGAIALSILSLFLPVFSYRAYGSAETVGYNLPRLLNVSRLLDEVFFDYIGETFHNLSDGAVVALVVLFAVIGVAAIVLALVGLISMSKQKESAWPFRLALIGLIGTAIPSVALLVLFLVSASDFLGEMYLGAYIIITPLAMILACVTVVSRHRLTREEARLQQEAAAFIRPAGDLPYGGFNASGVSGQRYAQGSLYGQLGRGSSYAQPGQGGGQRNGW